MFTLFFGGLIGAALMYFLAPSGGAGRRDSVPERFVKVSRSGIAKAGGTAHAVTDRAQGVVKEVVPVRQDNPDPDDSTLRDRVESELFRDPNLGRDKMNIMVVKGVVELRGELSTQVEIDDVIRRTKRIRNVKGVDSYLHPPQTPAPNKEEAIEAS